MILLLILILAPALAGPVAPWWAGPAERVLTYWGQAFIIASVPTGATVISRMISNRQHKQNLLGVEAATRDTTEIKAAIAVVQQEVRTANGLKLGALAEDAETRRVEEINPKKRTEAEQAHLDAVPPKH